MTQILADVTPETLPERARVAFEAYRGNSGKIGTLLKVARTLDHDLRQGNAGPGTRKLAARVKAAMIAAGATQ